MIVQWFKNLLGRKHAEKDEYMSKKVSLVQEDEVRTQETPIAVRWVDPGTNHSGSDSFVAGIYRNSALEG